MRIKNTSNRRRWSPSSTSSFSFSFLGRSQTKRETRKENAIQIFFNWMQRWLSATRRRWWGCPIIIVDPKTQLPNSNSPRLTETRLEAWGLRPVSSTNCWDYLFMEIYLAKSRRVNAPLSPADGVDSIVRPTERSAIILAACVGSETC